MQKSGLVSITFRNKTPLEIVKLMNRAGLSCVEWGGDIHVPPRGGKAGEVRALSRDYGIEICSYGSYYRLGEGRDRFLYSLDEACALETGVMRIWAGTKDSALVDECEWRALMEELFEAQELAKQRGILISLEYHPATLTDSRESAKKLLRELDCAGAENVAVYWQPRWDWPVEERLSALCDIRQRLGHMHVFTWEHTPGGIRRLPLRDGEKMWKPILDEYKDGCRLIEFVRGDCDEALMEDAQALNGWLNG